MKKVQIISSIILIFLLLTICIHLFIVPLSEPIVRCLGITMLIDIAVLCYSTIMSNKNN